MRSGAGLKPCPDEKTQITPESDCFVGGFIYKKMRSRKRTHLRYIKTPTNDKAIAPSRVFFLEVDGLARVRRLVGGENNLETVEGVLQVLRHVNVLDNRLVQK